MTVPNRYELLYVEEVETPVVVAPVAVPKKESSAKKVEEQTASAPVAAPAVATIKEQPKPVIPTKTVKEYMEETAAARLAALSISRPEARRANDGARPEGEALPEKSCSLATCDQEDVWIFDAKKEVSTKATPSTNNTKQFVQASLLSFKSCSNIEEEHKKADSRRSTEAFKPSRRGVDGEKRPFRPRRQAVEGEVAEGAENAAPQQQQQREFRPRRQAADGEKFRPRREGEESGVEKQREFRPRREGDREFRPRGEGVAKREFRPRNEGERRPFRPRHEGHQPSFPAQRREQDFPALSA